MTRAARSGKCWSSQCWNSGFTSQGRRSTMPNGGARAGRRGGFEDALDLRLVDERDDRRDAHAHRHAGARPAPRSCAAAGAARRRAARGCARARRRARSPRHRPPPGRARPSARSGRGRARRRDDLVTSENGCAHSASTSITERVMPQLALDRLVGVGGRADVDQRSAGRRGSANASRSRSAALTLAMMRVSKSSPGERLR